MAASAPGVPVLGVSLPLSLGPGLNSLRKLALLLLNILSASMTAPFLRVLVPVFEGLEGFDGAEEVPLM